MKRCIPIVIKDGTAKGNDQAVAICSSMYDSHHKKMTEETKTFARTLKGVDIFATGTWNGDKYSEGDLDAIVEAYGKAPVKPPVKLGHDEAQKWFGQKDGAPALGWVENVRRVGSKLVADFAGVPEIIARLIENKNYRTKSAEIFWNFKEPSGKVWPRVLKAVSLLGADMPAVSSLNDLHTALLTSNYSSDTTGHASWPTAETNGNGGAVKCYEYAANQDHGGNMETRKYEEMIQSLEAKLETEKSLREQMETRAIKAESAIATRDEDFAIKQFREQTLINLKKEGKVTPAEEESLLITFSSLGPGNRKYADKEVNPRELFVKSLTERKPAVRFGEGGAGGEDNSEGDAPASVEVDRRIRKFVDDGQAKTYAEGKELVKIRLPQLWERYIRG